MTLKSLKIRQMVALDYTLFPLRFDEVLNSLEKIGFELASSLPVPIPIGKFIGTGQVGRKGKTVCVLNAGDRSIQMIGDSIESTSDELNEFFVTILDAYKIDLFQRVNWFEFQSTHESKTKKNPVTLINTKFSNPIDKEISDIIGIDVKPVVARLGREKEFPNQVEWFDIEITPDFNRNDGFIIETIYRTVDKEKYDLFVANVRLMIEKVIKKIEE